MRTPPAEPRAAGDGTATPSQTVGPFFHFALTEGAAVAAVAPPDAPGARIRLQIRVLDGAGDAVTDALIELYQADAPGRDAGSGSAGFGRLPTGEDGGCVFEIVRPAPVAIAGGGHQAPHLSVCVFARGLLRHLYTRVYFEGDTIEGDPVLGCVPVARRPTLLARRSPSSDALWEFTIRLQGEHETVFFDL